jgi:hypothetical protein
MYTCERGTCIGFVCFYDFSIGFIELYRHCGIFLCFTLLLLNCDISKTKCTTDSGQQNLDASYFPQIYFI